MNPSPIGNEPGSKTTNRLALIAEHADIVDTRGSGVRDQPPYTTLLTYLNELKWREVRIDGIPEADRGKVVDRRIYAFLDDWIDKATRTVAESGGTQRAVLTYNSKDLPELP